MTDSQKRLAALALCAILVLAIVTTGGGRRLAEGMARLIYAGVVTGLGFGTGWFLSPSAKAARRVILLAALGLLVLVTLMGQRGASMSAATLLAIIGFCVGLGYWLGSAARDFFAKPETFGSAEWATLPYLEDKGLIADEGIRLGTMPSDTGPKPISYNGDRHLLTIAPTRSGKGTTVIVPNLLTYPGSCLVIDPKGENALITAQARRALGQTVRVVDPWGIAADTAPNASRFNPLDWLVRGDPDITENAMLLADALVMPCDKGEPFWVEEAKALLQGVILYVATDEHETAHRHLGRVRDLLLLDGEELPQLFQRMANSMHHVVASTGARSLQKDEKLLSNVLASAQAQTHFLDSPRLRDNLAASDFRFEDLKTSKTTIYLVLPADRLGTFGRWLRLLIQQAITVNARNLAVRPEKPVLFLLDELPALGKLSMVQEAYGLMAGFGLQLWGIVQDLGQLKDIYGDKHEGFIANSGVVSYFGSRDRMTAEYFSALCGEATVWNFSSAFARSVSSGVGGGSSSTSTTETHAWAQRKLAFPDELMRVAADRQIIFVENHHPIAANRTRWFDDPAFARLGRNLRTEIA